MSPVTRIATLALILNAAPGYAQDAVRAASADREWTNVLRLVNPIPSGTSKGRKTPLQLKGEVEMQAVLARQASDRARDFHLRYPEHAKATEARKLEALSGLRGVIEGDVKHQEAVSAVAMVYRKDLRIPPADRLEVALKMEQVGLSRKIKSRTAGNRAAAMEKIADDLKNEFGDLPAIQGFYLESARVAEFSRAAVIAAKIAHSGAASAAAKGEAQAILGRAALVGKALALKLPLLGGGEIDLSQKQDKLTVLVVQSPFSTVGLEPLGKLDNSARKNSQFVFLYLGGTAQEAGAARAKTRIAGRHCHAPIGPVANKTAASLQLQFTRSPFVYVVAKSGVLAGCGSLSEVATLVKEAGK
jgi:hypothetical protein